MDVKKEKFDVVVIGGGFYGCMLALFLKKYFKKILLIEKEKELLTRASYNNQARVHNGYHYPRSFITALRSHMNFFRFVSEFKNAIDDEFTMVYAVAKNSKVSSAQFSKFCRSVGSRIVPARKEIRNLFDKSLIEDVFEVEEVAFDALKLREIMLNKLRKAKIELVTNCEAKKVVKSDEGIIVLTTKGRFLGKYVFNCSYAQINDLLNSSNLPRLSFKYELTEMPLVEMPKRLERYAFTVIDGPFFSFVPFPPKKNLYTLHHVRYTPYESLTKSPKKIKRNKSRFLYMIKDAQRYVPALREVKYKGSLFEIKTILAENEVNDGRPILYRRNHGIENFSIVMGGKIDNIYDILERVGKDFS